MRLFSEVQVSEFIESGRWTDDDWDTALRRHAASHPDRLAVIDPPNRAALTTGPPLRLTWSQLDAEVDSIASRLFDHGVRADDIVGIQLPNVGELVVAYLALARIGAIATPFPVQYREHELNALLALVEAKAFMTAVNVLGRANAAALVEVSKGIESVQEIFAWGESCPPGVVGLDAGTRPLDVSPDYVEYVAGRTIRPNDCVTICWTSGTESLPKGIPRAFCDWGAVASGCIDSPSMTGDDVILNPFPLVNMGAFGGLFCPWILLGCTLVMHHPFDVETFMNQVQDEHVVYTVMPPALLTRLIQQPETLAAWDLSSIRAIGTGSAPVPGSTISGWEARGIEVINYFGSNEGLNLISDRTSVPSPQDRGHLFPSYRGDTDKLRVRVAKQTSIRLVDPESGDDIAAPGVVGELRLKGPTVFSGYVAGTGRPDVFDDQHFYCSGDLFEFTDESLELLRYRGRATDLIVRGGFNIGPAEIENVLQDHPAIAEVAVVGVPDDVLGDRICAFVVAQPGASLDLDDITTFMNDAQIAKFKWPEFLRTVDELPRNPVGKVLHRELRNTFVRDDES